MTDRLKLLIKRVDIYRLVLSIYMAGGLSLWCFLVTFNNPIIYEKIENARSAYMTAEQIPPPELVYIPGGLVPPDYPLGYYVCLIPLIVIPFVYFSPRIASIFRIKDRPIYRCVFILIIFSIIGGLTLVNFGVLFGYLLVVVARVAITFRTGIYFITEGNMITS